MAQSLAQLEREARNHLRIAFGMGCDEEAAIDYASRMMGEGNRALVGRVQARDFKVYGA